MKRELKEYLESPPSGPPTSPNLMKRELKEIDVRAEMPGSDHKLTFVQFDCMIRIGWGTWITYNERSFKALNADTQDVIWEVSGEKIVEGDGKFETFQFSLHEIRGGSSPSEGE